MLQRKNHKMYIILGVLIFAVGFCVLWALGFSVKGLSVKAPGAIDITVPLKGADVYVDGSKKVTTKEDNEVVRLSGLSAKSHTVVISKDNYWPWKKDIVVAGGVVSKEAFLVSKSISGVAITGADPEYERIKEMVEQNPLPTQSNKIDSTDRSTAVYVVQNSIYAEWQKGIDTRPSYFCSSEPCEPLMVLKSNQPIRNVAFYKNRPDVLIVALNDTIALLDLDPTGTQNFQPIYKGAAPMFTVTNHSSLFVSDGSSLMEIGI